MQKITVFTDDEVVKISVVLPEKFDEQAEAMPEEAEHFKYYMHEMLRAHAHALASMLYSGKAIPKFWDMQHKLIQEFGAELHR